MTETLAPSAVVKEIRECLRSGTPYVYLNTTPHRLRINDVRYHKGMCLIRIVSLETLSKGKKGWQPLERAESVSIHAGYPNESVLAVA